MKRPRFESITVDVGYDRYSVLCRIIPGRAPAKVGADSPRFMDPGATGGVTIYSVSKGGVDVTSGIDADLLATIKERVAKKAGIAVPARTVPRTDGQGTLTLEEAKE